jgi:hypothetical protein
MNSENKQESDELTQFLLNKCEVSSLNQFYHKWVEEIDHSVPIKNICAIHKNFNEQKVLKDISEIQDLLIITIPDYTQKKDFTREQFVIDRIGLGKILKSLKRMRIIKKSNPISNILKKLGVEETKREKFLNLLKKAINEEAIYANLIKKKSGREENELFVKTYSKIKHPEHRGDFLKLIITLILLVISLSILIPYLLIVNQ